MTDIQKIGMATIGFLAIALAATLFGDVATARCGDASNDHLGRGLPQVSICSNSVQPT